jgi:Protein of unknown function (DUF3992)
MKESKLSSFPKYDMCKIVCNNICGNLLLDDSVPNLEIWNQNTVENVIATISVFNSAMNVASIRVLINDNEGSSAEFTVPPGNTLSKTIGHVESIMVMRIGNGKTEGKFCLELCFPILCIDNKEQDKQNRSCKTHEKDCNGSKQYYNSCEKYKSEKAKHIDVKYPKTNANIILKHCKKARKNR